MARAGANFYTFTTPTDQFLHIAPPKPRRAHARPWMHVDMRTRSTSILRTRPLEAGGSIPCDAELPAPDQAIPRSGGPRRVHEEGVDLRTAARAAGARGDARRSLAAAYTAQPPRAVREDGVADALRVQLLVAELASQNRSPSGRSRPRTPSRAPGTRSRSSRRAARVRQATRRGCGGGSTRQSCEIISTRRRAMRRRATARAGGVRT